MSVKLRGIVEVQVRDPCPLTHIAGVVLCIHVAVQRIAVIEGYLAELASAMKATKNGAISREFNMWHLQKLLPVGVLQWVWPGKREMYAPPQKKPYRDDCSHH